MADYNSDEAVEIDGMICIPKSEVPEEKPPQEPDDKLYTCPKDPRFQQQNITKWCYQMFLDYHRCRFLLGNKPDCTYFERCYQSLCPNEWVEKWGEQIESGSFPRDLTRDAYYRGAV
ncbi:uncharacterized protein LOC142318275 [Lycorma delicatula]|uniref:uncharacterized protein LOC142318275 n=1 Tax=Lycorma delicatula TaxID=130591 RepID=UPI003F51407C